MKKITTYHNAEEALKALDNGGRFYKVETQANDGIIDQSELENLGGTFADKQQMILFLAMSILILDKSEKDMIFSKMDADIIKALEKFKPKELTPHQAGFKSRISMNTIITGIPKLIDPDSGFDGSIMFPVSAGNTTILMMTPLTEEYYVYKMKDESSFKTFYVGHLKHFDTLPEKNIAVGGVIKELKFGEGEYETQGKFLDITYYSEF